MSNSTTTEDALVHFLFGYFMEGMKIKRANHFPRFNLVYDSTISATKYNKDNFLLV